MPGLSRIRVAAALCLLGACPATLRANLPGGGPDSGAPAVSFSDQGATVTLANGTLTAVITKDNARVSSLLFRGVQLVNTTSAGPIYYSMDGGASYRQPSGCTFVTRSNTPDMVDVGMRQTWSNQTQAVDIEVHYVLRRGDTGLYTYAILDHPADYPATSFGEWRMVWKLPPDDTFERLYLDEARNRQMPSAADYAAAAPTGIAEIVQLTSGVLAGQYEGKYCYNTRYQDTPVYGHASNRQNIGVWVVFGSQEWFNDGPTKQDLAPAAGIIHVHFGRNHYLGSGTAIAAGEAWRKLYGPFLLYCNHDQAGADACWADAKAQVAAEQDAWPYSWLAGHPDFPAAPERATVSGSLAVRDPLKPGLTSSGAWIGLAAPDPGGNWQFESKRYQFWTRAAADGSFLIPHVRPGTYRLYAFAAGAVGEFESGPVTVGPGQTIQLGQLAWNVPRSGNWLAWEIGKADRSAAEFRHGTDYFTPYLWERFSSEFPNPLEYHVASSNPASDWNYAHTGYFTGDTSENWKWRIHFDLPALPAEGNARLLLAFAGSHYARLHLYVNDEANQFGPYLYPANGGGNALLRQGIHAKYAFEAIDIPVSRLRAGSNTITLLQGRSANTSDHVMYDYLALEMPTLPGGSAADGDADGLRDAWELERFGNLFQSGDGDPDADLAPNRLEQAAGSDPLRADSWPDTDGDLLNDGWELSHFPTLSTVAPLDDHDGDGFNAWVEFLAGTSPVLASSLPPGATHTVRTSDGSGFDGSLCEVNYSAAYDGSFVINDPNRRNNVYQNNGLRHYLTVWKFDLATVPPAPVLDASLALTVNGSSTGNRTRTLALFRGDNRLITPALRYDAANPFLDDTYLPETNTDTDFAPDMVASLLSFTNSLGAGTVETIGQGNPNLRAAADAALHADRAITLLLHGGNTQYLTQADDDPLVANRPALTIVTGPNPVPDSDRDGLPDAWEAQFLGTLDSSGQHDRDGDGTDDLTEFRLGLDPRDPRQTFKASVRSEPAGFGLSWPSRAGLSFEVRRSPDLGAGGWQTIATIAATENGTASFTDPAPPPGRAFYQIVLLP